MKKKYFFILIFILAGAWLVYSTNQGGVTDGQVLGETASSTVIQSTDQKIKIIFFDVGQGDAALIILSNNHQILVDGGPDSSIVQKLGEYLPPYDRKIEHVILSHSHSDHVGGLPEVLSRYEVGEVIFNGSLHTAPDYLEFLKLIEDKNINSIIVDQPQELNIQEVKLEFLAPQQSFLKVSPKNLNNSSLVFRLVYQSSTALFTGDMEDEESFLIQDSNQLESEILKVGHHGSTNANNKDFLAAVKPQYSIISVAKDNKFGHPHYRTVYYLKQLATKILRTDEAGDIVFISSGPKMELLTK